MKSLSVAARLTAAAAAAGVTFALLGSVVAIAEPQRSQLIAKTHKVEPAPASPVALALASAAGARIAR